MLRYEASSSLCIAALHIEEDPSLSLRMTNLFRLNQASVLNENNICDS
ncbi:hypothetical protein [Mucilaginibacter sp.]